MKHRYLTIVPERSHWHKILKRRSRWQRFLDFLDRVFWP